MQCKLKWHKGTAYHRLEGLTLQEVCRVPSFIRLTWHTICQCSVYVICICYMYMYMLAMSSGLISMKFSEAEV